MAARRPRPLEIFLSHAHQDQKFADRVVRILRRHRLHVWYSRKHIIGARRWHDEIGRALARCDWFVVILSPHSVRSDWVRHEVAFVLRAGFGDRIVPLLYRKCDPTKLSWVLPEYQFVDFTKDVERGFAELLRVWRLKYPARRTGTKPRSRR